MKYKINFRRFILKEDEQCGLPEDAKILHTKTVANTVEVWYLTPIGE